MQTSYQQSLDCLTHLQKIEDFMASSPSATPLDQEQMSQALIEVVDVYERSIKRKNAESDIIKGCILSDRMKLLEEVNATEEQVKTLARVGCERQTHLKKLESLLKLRPEKSVIRFESTLKDQSSLSVVNLQQNCESVVSPREERQKHEEVKTISIDLSAALESEARKGKKT